MMTPLLRRGAGNTVRLIGSSGNTVSSGNITISFSSLDIEPGDVGVLCLAQYFVLSNFAIPTGYTFLSAVKSTNEKMYICTKEMVGNETSVTVTGGTSNIVGMFTLWRNANVPTTYNARTNSNDPYSVTASLGGIVAVFASNLTTNNSNFTAPTGYTYINYYGGATQGNVLWGAYNKEPAIPTEDPGSLGFAVVDSVVYTIPISKG